MTLPQLLADYGYIALFVGCVLEGETILLLAGFAAHQGYLSLPLVMSVAFVGGTIGDQIFYFIGRRWGPSVIARVPWIERRVPTVNRLLLRHAGGLVIAIRFLYGLRIAGPVVIGMSTLTLQRFLVFNLIGAAIWAVLIAGAGYLFGESLNAILPDLGRYEGWGVAVLIAIVLVIGVAHRLMSKSK